MRHILIVEDDPATRDVLAAALTAAGASSMLSSDLGSAWEKLLQNRPVAVLCDTTVDPNELLHRMRSAPELLGVPLFLVTKPFDSVEIVDRLMESVTGTPTAG